MKHLIALVLVGLAAGCSNTALVGAPAPTIDGRAWIGAEEAPETSGRWLLVEFFSPT